MSEMFDKTQMSETIDVPAGWDGSNIWATSPISSNDWHSAWLQNGYPKMGMQGHLTWSGEVLSFSLLYKHFSNKK